MSDKREEIAESLERQIRTMAAVESDDPDFHREVHLFDYGYLDSFGAMELIAYSFETFGVRVTDEALATRPLNTINEIADFVAESSR